jgi:predicted aspartyl protease
MGTLEVRLQVSNPFSQAAVTVDALVDSGSIYSAMPASFLRDLGIEPFETRSMRIANGEVAEYETGVSGFSAEGRYGIAWVIFGPPYQYLIGATTLEDLALVIDPMGERVIPDDRLYL